MARTRAQVSKGLYTPLHLAVLQRYEEPTGHLLVHGFSEPDSIAADPNSRDQEGNAPLHWLVRLVDTARDRRVATSLIAHGADLHLMNDAGQSAIKARSCEARTN